MRHFKYIIVSAITLLILSCTDWLDIQPQTEIKQDKLFESESGFKDALIGCAMRRGRDCNENEIFFALGLCYTETKAVHSALYG